MESEGWQLDPGRTFVQPNLLPKTDWSPDDARGKARSPVPVSELVFFGRLETRKGAVTFCDAIDQILGIGRSEDMGFAETGNGFNELLERPTGAIGEASEYGVDGTGMGSQEVGTTITRSAVAQGTDETQSITHQHETGSVPEKLSGAQLAEVRSKLERVTFLGRSAIIEGEWGVEYVQRRARRWGGLPWKIVTRMDPLEAKEYLRGTGRLAVMPSKVENSPYTVYEVRGTSIRFGQSFRREPWVLKRYAVCKIAQNSPSAKWKGLSKSETARTEGV